MSTVEPQETLKTRLESETPQFDETFQDAPNGWKFRFVRGTKPEILRIMAAGAFRDALRESLAQGAASDDASPPPSDA